ncbi:TM2 domain-containing protein [Deinococcus marmoris]
MAQKRLIAGLLAIFLGSLGVHKFYLGMNTQGILILGANIGVWVLALLIGLLTLGFGLFITLPLAGVVSSALGLLGLVEGILYLTKSDADFGRDYLVGKKPWL